MSHCVPPSRDKRFGDDQLGDMGDDLYADLIAVHDGLSVKKSAKLNTRLVLMLMNEVGDPERIRAALKRARQNL
ncbi:MAG: DUF2783 domain-containing protein [Pseudomonadota bacterium]